MDGNDVSLLNDLQQHSRHIPNQMTLNVPQGVAWGWMFTSVSTDLIGSLFFVNLCICDYSKVLRVSNCKE